MEVAYQSQQQQQRAQQYNHNPASYAGRSTSYTTFPPPRNVTPSSNQEAIMNTGHPSMHSQASNYSIQSQPSSRSSDTTQGTSASTLFPPPLPPLVPTYVSPHTAATQALMNNGDVAPSGNVMNRVADASKSLFQICVSLRERLLNVPGFSDSLLEEEEYADQDTDPVTVLWRTFRRGYPLLMLYNQLRPAVPLRINDSMKEDKRGKAATFLFIKACVTDLKFPAEECFIVTDLYGDDTTGFVKVARVVNRVLDILVQRGFINEVTPDAEGLGGQQNSKRTQRQHIVAELVTTERTYVEHLELLQAFKSLVESKGIIPGDAVHDIFLNLNSLLDFQRRFLIRVEQTNRLPESEQNWGRLFLLYSEAFKVYEPYIANQRKCERVVVEQWPKLKEAGGTAEMRQMNESSTSLYGFLMKPFQRVSKYPLLLEDLYKKGDLDDERKTDLVAGKEAASSVLSRTNHAVDREEKAEAVQELKGRVEDWKGHRVEGFGDLLLYGTFTVLKSENISSGKDAERQYHVYLFETILLCCKDIDLSKPKNKMTTKTLVDKKGKPKMQLKGRIFMQNVTDLVSFGKPGTIDFGLRVQATSPIFWKGDPSIENFIIRFQTEEMMKKWAQQLEAQRRKYREREMSMSMEAQRMNGTSETEFEYMRNQPALENPYAQVTTEDDDDDSEGYTNSGNPSWNGHDYGRNDFGDSRNGSQVSLRSRSTTGESSAHPPSIMSSGIPSGRAAPPRMPPGSIPLPGQQPLSVRTQPLTSPGDRPIQDSYFSPGGESPSGSSRMSSMSSSSNMYPFPRQPYSGNNYYDDNIPHSQARFTAPAMARPVMGREGSAPPIVDGYGPAPPRSSVQTRNMHSTPVMPPPRNRSASSPDVHQGQRAPSRAAQPPVPDMPASYQGYGNPPHLIARSQTNSPAMSNGVPPRPATQSPAYQRERSYSMRRDDQPQSAHPQSAHPQSAHPSYESRAPSAVTSAFPQPPMSHSALPSQPMSHSSLPHPPVSRGTTPVPGIQRSQTYSPAIPALAEQPLPTPAQLKVKVNCPTAGQVLTLVVPLTISYQTLKDRIDAKLQRSTNLTLGLGSNAGKDNVMKLKYLDEDDFVTIQTDEDVQEAFETWREQTQNGETVVGMGEVELFCQR